MIRPALGDGLIVAYTSYSDHQQGRSIMDKEKTVVVFRVWPNGDVIALFPLIAAETTGQACQSYEHVGQHGSANASLVVGSTRRATSAEYRELASELRAIGYRLDVRRRCPQWSTVVKAFRDQQSN